MSLHFDAGGAGGAFNITDLVTTEVVNAGDTITFKGDVDTASSGNITATVSATDTVTYTLTETLTGVSLESAAAGLTDVRLVYTDENSGSTSLQLISQDANNQLKSGSDKGIYFDGIAGWIMTNDVSEVEIWHEDTVTFLANGDLNVSLNPSTKTLTYDFSETVTSWEVSSTGNNPALTYVNENSIPNTVQIVGGTNVTVTGQNDTITIDSTGGSGAVSSYTDQVEPTLLHQIGIHGDGNGGFTNVYETLTALGFATSGSDPVMRYVRENGLFTDIQFVGGTNVTISESEEVVTISATSGAGNTSIITNEIAGNRIATHNDGTGTLVDIDETITNWSVASGAGNPILRYTRENGAQDDIQFFAGTNVSINESGGVITISASPGGDGAVSAMSNVIAGHRIGTHNNGLGSTVDIDETITSLNLIGSNNPAITYTNENAVPTDVQFIGGTNITVTGGTGTVTIDADAETNTFFGSLLGVGNLIGIYTNENATTYNIRETITDWSVSSTGADPTVTFANEQGVDQDIQFVGGTNVTVTGTGSAVTIDASATGNTSVVTNVIAGNRIATHDDGTGSTVDIDETITSWAVGVGGSNPVLRYTPEAGAADDIQLVGGTNLSINSSGSTVTFNAAAGNTSALTNLIAGNRIATHNDGTGSLSDIDETITALSSSSTSVNTEFQLTYDKEGPGANDVINLITNDASNALTIGTDGGLLAPPQQASLFQALISGNQIANFTDFSIPLTTAVYETITTWQVSSGGSNPTLRFTREGGVTDDIQFVGGTNVTVTEAANIVTINSTAAGGGNTSIMTQILGTGNPVASHNDGTGTIVQIFETGTDLSYLGGTGSLYYQAEGGSTDTIPLVSTLSADNIMSFDSTGLNAYIQDTDSITGTGTIASPLKFVNDVGSPAGNFYYGTNAGGIKGWYALPGGGSAFAFDITDGITTQTINNSETITFAASGDVSVNVTPTDTVTYSFTETNTLISNLQAGLLIGTYVNENAVSYDIRESATFFTSLLPTGSPIGTYITEAGSTQVLNETLTDWSVIVQGTDPVLRYVDEGGNNDDIQFIGGSNVSIIGSAGAITINSTGSSGGGTISAVTNLISGNRIATHNDGDSVVVDIDETITALTSTSGSVNTAVRLFFDAEGPGSNTVNLVTNDADNVIVAGADGGLKVPSICTQMGPTTSTISNPTHVWGIDSLGNCGWVVVQDC